MGRSRIEFGVVTLGLALGLALGPACVSGGPAGEASGGLSVGSVGGTSTSTTGLTSTGTSSTSGADTGTGPAESESGAASCMDAAHNGDETDIDCGGSCPPCETGQACAVPGDCSTRVCEGELCCSSSTYEKSTGQISGSALVCCDGDDTRLDLTMCGTGVNYFSEPEGANCATTTEGAMNDGSACVTITCRALSCVPVETGTTM